MIVLTDGEDI